MKMPQNNPIMKKWGKGINRKFIGLKKRQVGAGITGF